ncbi:MAG: NADH-quinone oxidoreductase subunit C [Bacilli bacterium]|nr:NADH-quinone oxidoreductase subunit C [Bacilli bacterium]
MNSTNNALEVITLVESKYNVVKTEHISKYQVAFEVIREDIHSMLNFLKNSGWKQLSYLSAIDWPEEDKMELVYIVFNWDKGVHIQIRSKIDRENPEMDSILPIFPGCKYYEREAHEFFGIVFHGNPDSMKQLILEGWDDIPPLRKDFDPRAYSEAHFPQREYTETFIELNQQESKQEKRAARQAHIDEVRKGGKK